MRGRCLTSVPHRLVPAELLPRHLEGDLVHHRGLEAAREAGIEGVGAQSPERGLEHARLGAHVGQVLEGLPDLRLQPLGHALLAHEAPGLEPRRGV